MWYSGWMKHKEGNSRNMFKLFSSFFSLKLIVFKINQIHILIDKLNLYSPIGNSTTYLTSDYEIWMFY